MTRAERVEKLNKSLRAILPPLDRDHDIYEFENGDFLKFNCVKQFPWRLERQGQADTIYASDLCSIIFDSDYMRKEAWPQDDWQEIATELDFNFYLDGSIRAFTVYPTFFNLNAGYRETMTSDESYWLSFKQGEK
jgi:hypothetical protein